jgi:superfamily I DNA and/or RNA helicase
MLSYHYRSKYEELIAFSNFAFYGGRLYISPNANQPEKPPIQVIKVENGLWEERANKEEAIKTVELLKNFLINRKNNQTVGIITFNSSQRDLILDLIDLECINDSDFSNCVKKEFDRKKNGEDIGLFIKNIENVQGDERDCIIFSIAYAKDIKGRVVRNYGWLNQTGGENRLNVAISRAKEQIYIVTSIESDELITDDLKNDGPKIFKKYLEYAYAVSNGNNEGASRILNSFGEAYEYCAISSDSDNNFENKVYNALIQCGYNVEKQVGIGGYRIEIAIKDIKGNFILGIECDSKLYNNSKSTRDRDIHRQLYLEARGWKIHRIWSSDWWRNSKGEIDKIQKLIQVK